VQYWVRGRFGWLSVPTFVLMVLDGNAVDMATIAVGFIPPVIFACHPILGICVRLKALGAKAKDLCIPILPRSLLSPLKQFPHIDMAAPV